MKHDEMIAVIQAHKEGKEIQFEEKGREDWFKLFDPCWNFSRYNYRVNPREPREFVITPTITDGVMFKVTCDSCCKLDLDQPIRVREVL